MEIRILGPLEVVDGTRRVEINAPKQRLLLSVLALAGGRVVSIDFVEGYSTSEILRRISSRN